MALLRKSKKKAPKKSKKKVEKKVIPEIVEPIEKEIPEIQITWQAQTLSTIEQPDNRMLRHRKNMPCPACNAQPTICVSKKPMHIRRCRACGHKWEVK